ncbi:unnamed protein product [Eruca vesicaria subsp. sativa]|uniref:Uncharacterized protein n=1 Tax=Eruca vesicaria subsp. sativa TaxID=29727 RepID=A0ABC8JRH1_ERUVS|nr:unnamed protein product [Eruca vesicaria subsp. sativa]
MLNISVRNKHKDSVYQKLQKLLPKIEASLKGSKILYANVYDPMLDMMQNPNKYGISRSCFASFLALKRRREDVVEQGIWR